MSINFLFYYFKTVCKTYPVFNLRTHSITSKINYCTPLPSFIQQARVVQRIDNTIHWITHYMYPVDSVVCFVNTYPVDSDLSDG